MADEWKKFLHTNEKEYFHKQNEEAMKRLQSRKETKPRLSPITGNPMEQITLFGAVVDRCPESEGIWLDAGELEQILHHVTQDSSGGGFFNRIVHAFKKATGAG